jgi:peroxiredoxin
MSSNGTQAPGFGELARDFTYAADGAYQYSFGAAAGRWTLLMFFGTLSQAPSLQAVQLVANRRRLFDGQDAAFFGVSLDAADRARGLSDTDPALTFVFDLDRAISRLYGVADDKAFWPAVFLIDPMFRIVSAKSIEAAGELLDQLQRGLADAAAGQGDAIAPVLVAPRIFEPQLCAALIDHYRQGQPIRSGFAMTRDGRTVEQVDPMLKRRQDVFIDRADLVAAVRRRLETRLFPLIKRSFGWQAQHIERYLVCRYAAEDQGFFVAHRDDVTAGSAHRKFAVSVNLNAEDHDGGDLRFPEFGRRTYRPPTGGAAVFSCNLLHEATPVTRGERFVLVPFLFDEAGEAVRVANRGLVDA